MNIEDIDKLIAKFYRGDTDGKEEECLASYFAQDNPPVSQDKDRDVLLALSSFTTEVPSGLEPKIASVIDAWERKENERAKHRLKMGLRKRVVSIVASVLLVVGIGFWYQYQSAGNRSALTESFESPQESQEAVVEALRLFSHNFSKGTKVVEDADSHVDKAFAIIDQALNNKPVHGQDSVELPDK